MKKLREDGVFDNAEDSELQAFTSHAVGLIEEWTDPAEDDTWN